MATQGTTQDFIELLNLMQKSTKDKRAVPEGKVMFISDPPGTYNRTIGVILDVPANGGLNAPFS